MTVEIDIENEELMKDSHYYNFFVAIDTFGFDFDTFIQNGFATFIQETYIKDFIDCRKSYITRNFSYIRFIAHKFKGCFS